MQPIEPWKNPDFLQSSTARPVRILSEYLEPQKIFRDHHIHNTIVFWGSSRALPPGEAKKCLVRAKKTGDKEEVREAECLYDLSEYYTEARELARMITEWSKHLGDKPDFIVATGGAQGIMEAANRGAADARGKSVGLGIALPREEEINEYVTRELAMQFHYFFMRKFWMVYLAKALVVFPGGFGTMDELSEMLTLCQTHKSHQKKPIVLYGSEYWRNVINFDEMIRWGTISPKDKNIFKFCDTPQEAFDYLTTELTRRYSL